MQVLCAYILTFKHNNKDTMANHGDSFGMSAEVKSAMAAKHKSELQQEAAACRLFYFTANLDLSQIPDVCLFVVWVLR